MSTLYVVATPIGNREDITIRAIKTLLSVPVIACEDTRVTGQLLHYLKNTYPKLGSQTETPPMEPILHPSFKASGTLVGNEPSTAVLISYRDETEEIKLPEILSYLESGKDVALVSDAGTPLVSDPGFRLIRECFRRNVRVCPVPGASSITASLSVSPLPSNTFFFAGYLPEKTHKRQTYLQEIKKAFSIMTHKPAVIVLIPVHDAPKILEDSEYTFGNVKGCLLRELTKIHEEVRMMDLLDMIKLPLPSKGELVLIFNPQEELLGR